MNRTRPSYCPTSLNVSETQNHVRSEPNSVLCGCRSLALTAFRSEHQVLLMLSASASVRDDGNWAGLVAFHERYPYDASVPYNCTVISHWYDTSCMTSVAFCFLLEGQHNTDHM